MLRLNVAVRSKVFNKTVVGENTGLGKAVHTFANFDGNRVVVNEWS
jgi:hypothetical protein